MVTHELRSRIITGFLLSAAFLGIYFYLPIWVLSACFMLVLIAILCFEWPKLQCWLLTPLYPVAPFIFLVLLNQSSARVLLLLLIIMVVTHDSGAYFIGKRWGKHKIAPSISPGKSWEGFAAGYIASCCATWCFFAYNNTPVFVLFLLSFTLLINSAALVGDLFESYLKRRVHLKDTGNILPGHGGLLDRCDSLMFSGIIMYLLRNFL